METQQASTTTISLRVHGSRSRSLLVKSGAAYDDIFLTDNRLVHHHIPSRQLEPGSSSPHRQGTGETNGTPRCYAYTMDQLTLTEFQWESESSSPHRNKTGESNDNFYRNAISAPYGTTGECSSTTVSRKYKIPAIEIIINALGCCANRRKKHP